MASEKDIRDNTKALNNLAGEMASISKVFMELNKNLVILGRQAQTEQPVQELHGVCTSIECSNQQKHNHGLNCGIKCPCESVRERTSRQFQAYVRNYPVPVGTTENFCRDVFCENEEKHSHGKSCGKSCSEPTCVRE